VRREHWVPLSTHVVELLEKQKGIVGDEGHLFPGQKEGMPISEGTAERAIHLMGFANEHSVHGFGPWHAQSSLSG
jgi:integrase